MSIFNNDFTHTATVISLVIKSLNELEQQLWSSNDIYGHKDDFMMVAYMCRLGILDRIERNGWNLSAPIKISLGGLFNLETITLAVAVQYTVGRLKKMVSDDYMTSIYVQEVFDKKGVFHQLDMVITDAQRMKMKLI